MQKPEIAAGWVNCKSVHMKGPREYRGRLQIALTECDGKMVKNFMGTWVRSKMLD